MIKVLYLVHAIELNCHQHIIDKLRFNNIEVRVESLGPAPKDKPNFNVWKNLQDNEYLEELYKENFSFVVSNTHSEYLSKLRNKLVNTIFIDMEHDLFSEVPTHFEESTIFTFQKKHTEYCKSEGISFIECIFPKFSAEYKKVDLGIDKFSEVFIVGTTAFNKKIKDGKVVFKRGFKKIWYKKYTEDWDILKGTEKLPYEFTGPLGILNCADNFNFLLTVESSSFVEFILLGKLPILLSKENKKYGSIFDKIDGKSLQPIIKELRNNPDMFKQVNKNMFNMWATKDYFKLPSAGEALLKFIKDNK